MRSPRRRRIEFSDEEGSSSPAVPLASETQESSSLTSVSSSSAAAAVPSPANYPSLYTAQAFPTTVVLANEHHISLLDPSPFPPMPKNKSYSADRIAVLQAVFDQAQPRDWNLSKDHATCVAAYLNVSLVGAQSWFSRAKKKLQDDEAKAEAEHAGAIVHLSRTDLEDADLLFNLGEADEEADDLFLRAKKRLRADRAANKAAEVALKAAEATTQYDLAILALRRALFEAFGNRGWVIPKLEIACPEEWVYPDGVFLGGDVRTLEPIVIRPAEPELDLHNLFWDNTIPLEYLLDYPPDPTFAPMEVIYPSQPTSAAAYTPRSPPSLTTERLLADMPGLLASAYLASDSDMTASSLTTVSSSQDPSSPVPGRHPGGSSCPLPSALGSLNSSSGSTPSASHHPHPRTKPQLRTETSVNSGPPDFLTPDVPNGLSYPTFEHTGPCPAGPIDLSAFDPILRGPKHSSKAVTSTETNFLGKIEGMLMPPAPAPAPAIKPPAATSLKRKAPPSTSKLPSRRTSSRPRRTIAPSYHDASNSSSTSSSSSPVDTPPVPRPRVEKVSARSGQTKGRRATRTRRVPSSSAQMEEWREDGEEMEDDGWDI